MFFRKIRRFVDSLWPREMSRELQRLDAECEAIRDQIDLFKSSLEVPVELCDEWSDWRSRTPIPSEPLVSVCVATYNRAQLLIERSLPSVLSQTYSNFELIVVGDGCSDETERVVARIDDSRLKFVNLPARGSYPADPLRKWMVAGTQAINHALALAGGDYITHLDDDDEYLPDRLERLVRAALKTQCDFIWHPFWIEEKDQRWRLIDAMAFRLRQVTTGSVFYRSWFKKIKWDVNAHRLWEPGDWNRFRKIKYLATDSFRYPKPLLRHYRENISLAT